MVPFDIILVLPYSFSDHPSFPEALLKRALEREGFRVGVLERPFWQQASSFTVLGRPKLCFAIISGPLDSLVLNYTASGKRRREDLYQADGSVFFPNTPASVSSRIRPDRTVVVFGQKLKEAFPGVTVVVGGIEASLRLFTHYDFVTRGLKGSVLLDSRADIAVWGMGERTFLEVARLLSKGAGREEIIVRVEGTAGVVSHSPEGEDTVLLPSHEELMAEPALLLRLTQEAERAAKEGKTAVQPVRNRWILRRPPIQERREELDRWYSEPYSRNHPSFPNISQALGMCLFSVTTHRGCGGGCSFCSILGHQGKGIVSRSLEGILREVASMTQHPRWKGVICDVGGASAEMYGADCQASKGCSRRSCLFPERCGNFTDGAPYLALLRAVRRAAGVKKVFVGSGLRYDLLLANPELLEEILLHHSGEFLRVAPEHTSTQVLSLMGKPSVGSFESFVKLFGEISRGMKRKIRLLPYLMVGHPGEREEDVDKMARLMKGWKIPTTDVQIFTPTPGTLSTALYVAGYDKEGRVVPVERDIKRLERRKERLTSLSRG